MDNPSAAELSPAASPRRLPASPHPTAECLSRPPRRQPGENGYYPTIPISRAVLFNRRPPVSVHVTMSSIRTPKRPGR
ncbi:hypothetical protein GCM10010361_63900 [Streptomyces olivaceiscleroticus]|uniref:Uncharacterized protein n=1 Tax=Streptomyces olivaceiscleroticus TaxID=68245 RepID=A0ABP3L2F0_9ACTN